jgi:hypothetical protein
MASSDESNAGRALTRALTKLLAPLVRLLLRYGVTYGAFIEVAKHVYVRVAATEFLIGRRKQSASRIAVLTGLPRKEVARLVAATDAEVTVAAEEHSRVARLIGGWRRDRRFADGRGHPASLPVDGAGASFAQLVKRYGTDVPVRAALDEMLRVGAAERLKDGRVRLTADSFVPPRLDVDKFEILGSDVADIIATIDHNVTCGPGEAFFQRKTTYDNVPQEAIPKLRETASADAEKLLLRVDGAFAKQDRDINPNAKGTGRKRVVLGIWYYEDDFEEPTHEHEDEPPKE